MNIHPGQKPKWIVRQSREIPAKARVFCFPYAGGGASLFLRWNAYLPEDTEVVAVQLPGRENRINEPYAESVEQIVEHIAKDIAPLLDVPCVFFGHSFGALLCVELAWTLLYSSSPMPKHLIVSGANPPNHRLDINVPTMSDAELLNAVQAWGGHRLDSFGKDFSDCAIKTLRADIAILDAHDFKKKGVPIRLLVLGGSDDPLVSMEPLQGWSKLSPSCEIVIFEGGHFFIEQHRDAILARVVEHLCSYSGSQAA